MGRPCLEHAQGEPRKAAIDWLIRHLRLKDAPPRSTEGRARLE